MAIGGRPDGTGPRTRTPSLGRSRIGRCRESREHGRQRDRDARKPSFAGEDGCEDQSAEQRRREIGGGVRQGDPEGAQDGARVDRSQVDAAQHGQEFLDRRAAQDLRDLAHGDVDADAGHVPDQQRPGQEFGQESQGRQAHRDEHERHQQGESRRHPDPVVGRDRERRDCRTHKRRGGGIRSDDESARRPEDRVRQERYERCIQARLGRQPGDLGVPDAQRHDQGGDGQPADPVLAELVPAVSAHRPGEGRAGLREDRGRSPPEHREALAD